MDLPFKHILISRTDALGDVVLTLPVCGVIKANYPGCRISFLGKSYTEEIIKASKYVDEFIDYDKWNNLTDDEAALFLKDKNIDVIIHILPRKRIAKIAKMAGIEKRIGTTNRVFHWLTCNKLIALGRKNSDLHEALLNIHLLKGIGINQPPLLSDLYQYYGLSNVPELEDKYKMHLSGDKLNIIIHPKSRGSAKELNLRTYTELINRLDSNEFNIFITGTAAEKDELRDWLSEHQNRIVNLVGEFTMDQFLAFVKNSDGLIAASTGPLHIASAFGINSLGLFSLTRPLHAGRWAPIGKNACWLDENISSESGDLNISAERIFRIVNSWRENEKIY